MPYIIRKLPNRSCFKVYNKETKRVYSKCTSKRKSIKQVKLLRMIENMKNKKTKKQKNKINK